jgi:hypothetical protein
MYLICDGGYFRIDINWSSVLGDMQKYLEHIKIEGQISKTYKQLFCTDDVILSTTKILSWTM